MVSAEQGSRQHWNLFLGPPPVCKKLRHVRIDRCGEDANFWGKHRCQNSTAQSPARSPERSCRSNLVTFFDTSILFFELSWSNVDPLPLMIRKCDRRRRWRRTWCLFRSCFRNRFPCTVSNFIGVVLLGFFWHLRYVFVYSIHDHHPWTSSIAEEGVDHDLDSVTALMVTDCSLQTGPIFVFPRIHPFTLDGVSSRSNVYSRHGPHHFASSASSWVVKYCPFATVFTIPASERSLINRRSFGRFANVRSYSRSKSPCTRSLVRSGCSLSSATMVSDLSSATGLDVLSEQPEILQASSSHSPVSDPACFLWTRPRGFLFHRAQARCTPALGTGAQCVMLHLRPRARPLSASRFIVCRVEIVFPRGKLTHVCVISRAFINGGCTYAFEAARQGKTAAVTDQTGHWIRQASRCSGGGLFTVDGSTEFVHTIPYQTDYWYRQASSTSQTRQSRHLPLVGGAQPLSWPMTTPPANGVRHGSPRSLARSCRRTRQRTWTAPSGPPHVHLAEAAGRRACQVGELTRSRILFVYEACISIRLPCHARAPRAQLLMRLCATCHHCSLAHLRVQHCVHLVVWKMTPRTSRAHVLTTSPRLPDSDRQKRRFFDSCIAALAKHGPRSLTCVPISRESHPSGTDGDGRRASDRLWRHRRQHGRSPTVCASYFCSNAWICARRTTEILRVSAMKRWMLGSVHDGRPTVVL